MNAKRIMLPGRTGLVNAVEADGALNIQNDEAETDEGQRGGLSGERGGTKAAGGGESGAGTMGTGATVGLGGEGGVLEGGARARAGAGAARRGSCVIFARVPVFPGYQDSPTDTSERSAALSHRLRRLMKLGQVL